MVSQSDSKETGEKTERIDDIMDIMDISEINVKGCNYMDSIFNALESPRNEGASQNMTMKLLQL
jgi:hypothetical protein